MKNNYPIKYALIPMIEQVGWAPGLNELEREYGIVCYIASKCYVVKETKEYCEDGNSKVEYQIVCPYQYDDLDIWKRCEPSFHLIQGHCINGITTNQLFDSYEEALSAKNEKNDEIILKKCIHLRYDENFRKRRENLINEFSEKLDYYNQLEKAIEDRTSELKVNHINKKPVTVVYKDNEYKKVDMSLYSMIKLYDNVDFIVYTVDDELFNRLLDGDKVLSNRMSKLLSNDGANRTMKLTAPSMHDKYIYNKQIHNNCQYTFPNIFINYVSMYTTETYQDVLDSYKTSDEKVNTIKLVRKK